MARDEPNQEKGGREVINGRIQIPITKWEIGPNEPTLMRLPADSKVLQLYNARPDTVVQIHPKKPQQSQPNNPGSQQTDGNNGELQQPATLIQQTGGTPNFEQPQRPADVKPQQLMSEVQPWPQQPPSYLGQQQQSPYGNPQQPAAYEVPKPNPTYVEQTPPPAYVETLPSPDYVEPPTKLDPIPPRKLPFLTTKPQLKPVQPPNIQPQPVSSAVDVRPTNAYQNPNYNQNGNSEAAQWISSAGYGRPASGPSYNAPPQSPLSGPSWSRPGESHADGNSYGPYSGSSGFGPPLNTGYPAAAGYRNAQD